MKNKENDTYHLKNHVDKFFQKPLPSSHSSRSFFLVAHVSGAMVVMAGDWEREREETLVSRKKDVFGNRLLRFRNYAMGLQVIDFGISYQNTLWGAFFHLPIYMPIDSVAKPPKETF